MSGLAPIGKQASAAPKRDTAAIISAWVEDCLMSAPAPEKMHFATYLGTQVSVLVEKLDGAA